MSFGYLLRKFRNERRLSLRELSKLTGIDHTYIQRLESGQKESPSDQVTSSLITSLKLKGSKSNIFQWIVGKRLPESLVDLIIEESIATDIALVLALLPFKRHKTCSKSDWLRLSQQLESFVKEENTLAEEIY